MGASGVVLSRTVCASEILEAFHRSPRPTDFDMSLTHEGFLSANESECFQIERCSQGLRPCGGVE